MDLLKRIFKSEYFSWILHLIIFYIQIGILVLLFNLIIPHIDTTGTFFYNIGWWGIFLMPFMVIFILCIAPMCLMLYAMYPHHLLLQYRGE